MDGARGECTPPSDDHLQADASTSSLHATLLCLDFASFPTNVSATLNLSRYVVRTCVHHFMC